MNSNRKATDMKLLNPTVLTVVGVTLLRLMLDFSYVFYIAPSFSYAGMVLAPDPIRYANSWIGLIVVLAFVLQRKNSLSTDILFSLIVFAFVPLTSFYALAGSSHLWFWVCMLFWVLVSWVCAVRLPAPKISRPKDYAPALLLPLAIALIAWVIVIIRFGASISFYFDDVYEIRAANKLSAVPLGGYLIPWAASIAVPALIVLGWKNKGVLGTGVLSLAVLMASMLFSATGHKAYIISLLLVIGLYWIARAEHRLHWIAFGCCVAVLGSAALDFVTGNINMSSLITRRVFFVPAMLSNAYFEFFDGKFMYLSHSILSPWIENPLQMSPSFAVGEAYLGSIDQNANNGVMADGYMNFGLVGVFAWAILLGTTTALFEASARTADSRIAFALGVNAFSTFINGAFFTGLLTNGVLLAFLIIVLCPAGLTRRTRTVVGTARSRPNVVA